MTQVWGCSFDHWHRLGSLLVVLVMDFLLVLLLLVVVVGEVLMRALPVLDCCCCLVLLCSLTNFWACWSDMVVLVVGLMSLAFSARVATVLEIVVRRALTLAVVRSWMEVTVVSTAIWSRRASLREGLTPRIVNAAIRVSTLTYSGFSFVPKAALNKSACPFTVAWYAERAEASCLKVMRLVRDAKETMTELP